MPISGTLVLWWIGCASESPDPCEALDPAACAADERCAVIQGRTLIWPDTGAGCYGLANVEPRGCRDASLGCDEVVTLLSAPDGTCTWFPTSCVPGAWTEPCPLDGYASEPCS